MASSPQISGVSISGKTHSSVLEDIGTALLQVKNTRGLRLADMAEALRKSDDQMARYIAGERRRKRLTETANERALRAKQRSLDIDLPVKRDRAA
jgi:hypothetical protein